MHNKFKRAQKEQFTDLLLTSGTGTTGSVDEEAVIFNSLQIKGMSVGGSCTVEVDKVDSEETVVFKSDTSPISTEADGIDDAVTSVSVVVL